MADTTPLAPTDAELLGLNVGEVYFSESPSKYPEVHGTQYHAGAPGVLAFAREALAKWGAQPVVPAGYALVPVEASEDMKSAAVKYANGAAVYKNVRAEVLRIEEGIYGEVYAAMLAEAPQPVARKAMTRQQLREAFHKATGCTLGGDIDLAERVCGVVERAHGITASDRRDDL